MGRRVLRNKVDLLTFVSRAIPNVPSAPPGLCEGFIEWSCSSGLVS